MNKIHNQVQSILFSILNWGFGIFLIGQELIYITQITIKVFGHDYPLWVKLVGLFFVYLLDIPMTILSILASEFFWYSIISVTALFGIILLFVPKKKFANVTVYHLIFSGYLLAGISASQIYSFHFKELF